MDAKLEGLKVNICFYYQQVRTMDFLCIEKDHYFSYSYKGSQRKITLFFSLPNNLTRRCVYKCTQDQSYALKFSDGERSALTKMHRLQKVCLRSKRSALLTCIQHENMSVCLCLLHHRKFNVIFK